MVNEKSPPPSKELCMSTPRRSQVAPLRIGLPLLGLIVGGSVALSYFVQGKYDIQASCACAGM